MGISARTLNDDQESSIKAHNIITNDDHISELPDDILSFILSFMTLRDAFKSRVLSPRWRYLTASTSNLQFDIFNMLGIKLQNSAKLWEGRFRFVKAVDQFLQQYGCPKIHSLKLSYCLGNESGCYIDRWINFAVGLKIEDLDVDLSTVPEDCERYLFYCHLLSKASHLKYLSLKLCTLRRSSSLELTNKLDSLKVIDFKVVNLLDQSAFDTILSCCTNLECLRLVSCRLPVNFFIRGPGTFLCLKLLVLRRCKGAEKIEISSIDLVTLEYEGIETELRFVGVSSLESMYYIVHDFLPQGLSKDLPRLQYLSLFLCISKAQRIPAKLNNFNHLKELKLIIGLGMNFNLLSLARILNACPYLQKLHLELRSLSKFFVGELVKWRCTRQLYYHLKEIEITGFFGDRCNEFALAIYLLHSAVGLERMVVNLWRGPDLLPMTELEKKRVHDVLSNKKNPNVELIICDSCHWVIPKFLAN